MTSGDLIVYRGCAPVVEAQYERDNARSLVEAIVDALAEADGVDATDFPQLYRVIDTDALNDLVEVRDDSSAGEVLVCFSIDGWNVFVGGDGRISVCDGAEPTEPAPVFAGPGDEPGSERHEERKQER